ncbi:MAG: uracil phosphoribosyltransferase [Myxococcales bacterium]|nr:uracil phosphoribosyltransferase [Myxococcales bacterium]
MSGEVHVIDHPLVQHKLTIMRKKETSTASFRRLLGEVSLLLGYEVTRNLPLVMEEIETPLAQMQAPLLEGKKVLIVSILRAGTGILDGILQLMPSARVGHLGLYRDPKTLKPVEYYCKLPEDISERSVLVVDPMLATGHSAAAAIERLKERKPKDLKFLCLLAAPEGIKYFHDHHPDVPIYTAAVDDYLNEKGYIVPGLGDAGDRIFGTK